MANDKAYNVQGLMVFTLDLFIIGDCQDDPILPTNQYSLIAVRARLVLIFCQLYANLLNKTGAHAPRFTSMSSSIK